jgi:hypothetical protein
VDFLRSLTLGLQVAPKTNVFVKTSQLKFDLSPGFDRVIDTEENFKRITTYFEQRASTVSSIDLQIFCSLSWLNKRKDIF